MSDTSTKSWVVAMIKLSGRVDLSLEQNKTLLSGHEDHENRLRILESSRWPLPTVSVLIALASLLVALFKSFGGK